MVRRTDRDLFEITRSGAISRRNFIFRSATIGAGLGFAPLLVACGNDDGGGSSEQGQPLRAGVVRPTTGDLASSFDPLYATMAIAIEEINAAGGILGHPIEVTEEDDEGLPARQPTIATKLDQNGFGYVLGPTGSSQALASVEATTRAEIIQATFANVGELGDATKYPYHYQLTFTTGHQGTAASRFLVEQLGVTKVGILQENTAFGEEATAASRATLEELGIEVVATEVYPIDATDLDNYVRSIRNADADGVLAWMANVTNIGQAFASMDALDFNPPVAGHNSLFTQAVLDVVDNKSLLENVYATHYKTLTWTEDEPIADRQQAFGEKLAEVREADAVRATAAGAPYYDFLHLLAEVMEAEDTMDRDVIKAALDNTSDYEGILGTINFTAENHSGHSPESIAMASVLSVEDDRSLGVFRERGQGA